MLKLNTLLTGVTTLLLGLLCWIGKGMWDDIALAKTATIATQVKIESMARQLDDHENRLRQDERDITVLQNEHVARSPKDKQNN